MNNVDFDRLNFLADKALNEKATNAELEEFNQLLTVWNESIELNLFSNYDIKHFASVKEKANTV